MIKVFHSADWHLGKKLDGISRHEEQVIILDSIIDNIKNKKPDMLIIAGDIYDSVNPPAESELLFYNTLKKIIKLNCLVVIISGNHDNATRLSSTRNLLNDEGVIFVSTPYEIINKSKGSYYEILNSYKGGFELLINDKVVNINTLSYPNEVNLDEDFSTINYSEYIGNIFKEQLLKCREDSIVIQVGHLFTIGSIKDGDERNIELGGSLQVSLTDIPKVNYTALGHIHKPQIFSKYNLAYSGSILEYRSSEAKFEKCILEVDINKDETNINKIMLPIVKPIKHYKFNDITKAILFLDNHQEDEYIYLELNLNSDLTSSEIKEIKKNKNVVEITLNFMNKERVIMSNNSELDVNEEFRNFYLEVNNEEVSNEQYELFLKILKEVEDETN